MALDTNLVVCYGSLLVGLFNTMILALMLKDRNNIFKALELMEKIRELERKQTLKAFDKLVNKDN